jgi:predicted metalloendopeptidase
MFTQGMHYDKNGNYIGWWTDASKKAFELKSHCLSDQYSNYTLFGKNVSVAFDIAFLIGFKPSVSMVNSYFQNVHDN